MANPGELDAVNRYRYVSLTTFRRNGSPVSTPVWMARDDEDLVFISDDDTGKTKRLRRDPRVELRPCSIRGVVAQGAPTHRGTATMRRDDAAIRRVRAAIGRKYPTGRLLNMVTRLGRRAGLVRRTSVAIVIRLGD